MSKFDNFNDSKEDKDDVTVAFTSNSHNSSPSLHANRQAIIKWTVSFLLIWQVKHFISYSCINVMTKLLSALLEVLCYFLLNREFFTVYIKSYVRAVAWSMLLFVRNVTPPIHWRWRNTHEDLQLCTVSIPSPPKQTCAIELYCLLDDF